VYFKEREAALQTALRFGISVSTVRRWHQDYRGQGKRGLLPKVSYHVGRQPKLNLCTFENGRFRTLCKAILNDK